MERNNLQSTQPFNPLHVCFQLYLFQGAELSVLFLELLMETHKDISGDDELREIVVSLTYDDGDIFI